MCAGKLSTKGEDAFLQDLEVGLQLPILDLPESDHTIGTGGFGANADLDAGALLLPWGLPYRQPRPAYRSRPRGHGGGQHPWGIPSHQPWPADGNRPRGCGGNGADMANTIATDAIVDISATARDTAGGITHASGRREQLVDVNVEQICLASLFRLHSSDVQ